jgi:hypothetical protein
MEEIKKLLNENYTLKIMLLNNKNRYNKVGALEQIKLDTGLSKDFISSNWFEIISLCS